MNKIVVFTVLLLLVISSCGDCYREIKGIVIDCETKEPIDSVRLNKVKHHEIQPFYFYTDQTGKFELSDIQTGLLSCPKSKVSFFKDGYSEIIVEFKNNNDTTICLCRIEQ